MRRLATLSALLVCLLAAPAERAPGAIYWGAGSTIGSANVDGSVAMSSFPYGEHVSLLGTRSHVCGVAVDGTDLYWSDREGAIGRLGLRPLAAGPLDILKEQVPLDEAFLSGLTDPCGVAVDAGHVYWASPGGLAIGRAALNGGGADPTFIVGAARPCGVAVDAGHVYWANSLGGTIGRASLDGIAVDQDFITGAVEPCGVAVDGAHVYWANQGLGSIGRASLDGSGVTQGLVTGLKYPCGVAVDATHVYWVGELGGRHEVGRARLDGGAVEPALVAGLDRRSSSCGIAVDSRVWKSAPPGPSRPFFLGAAKKDRKRGVAVVNVKVPADGGNALAVTTPGVAWRLLGGPVRDGGYLIWRIRVAPGSGGGAAKRLRRALARKGWASFTLGVTFQEPGAGLIFATRQLTLVSV